MARRAVIGISGYDYKPWRGRFYPEALPARRWLESARPQFASIAPKGTFYSLHSPGAGTVLPRSMAGSALARVPEPPVRDHRAERHVLQPQVTGGVRALGGRGA